MPSDDTGRAGIVGSLARTVNEVLTPLIPRGTAGALLDIGGRSTRAGAAACCRERLSEAAHFWPAICFKA